MGLMTDEPIDEDMEYEIGHGKPPLHTRFKKGQSGNPRGRPQGSRNTKTIVQEFARERHKVKEGGRTRTVTTTELLLRLLVVMSMKGDVRASKIIEGLRDRFDPSMEEFGYLVVPEEMTPEEWMRQQKIENEFRRRPRTRNEEH